MPPYLVAAKRLSQRESLNGAHLVAMPMPGDSITCEDLDLAVMLDVAWQKHD